VPLAVVDRHENRDVGHDLEVSERGRWRRTQRIG
jgi:hypothetical protein